MKKAAVITSQGLGDGLIMTVVAKHLIKLGYAIDFFNPHLHELKDWFLDYHFKTYEDLANTSLADYDWVFCQYSNTALVEALKKKKKECKKFSFIYAAYNPQRHDSLTQGDFVCDPRLPLVESLKIMGEKFFHLKNASKETGIKIPNNITFQKYPRRILIHPTSTCQIRTWHKERYLKFAYYLQEIGFSVSFIMSSQERDEWTNNIPRGFAIPFLKNLDDLAKYTYESRALIGNDSGPAHLASLMGLKTLIITNDPKRLVLWQPGWEKAQLIFPPKWVPNFKFLRLKINHWQIFTSVGRVVKGFKKIQNSISLPERKT